MNPATFLPFFSTLAGGYAALRLRHRLHALMAIAAGVVVATALADLLPEAFELLGPGASVQLGAAAVIGFIGFTLLEAFLHQSSFEHAGTLGHAHSDVARHDHDDDHEDDMRPRPPTPTTSPTSRRHAIIGLLPPSSLVLHSAMDGLMIGVAFQAGDQIGLIVLIAVLFHDFADGMNVATVALQTAGSVRAAVLFIFLDGIAAPIGGLISAVVSIDEHTLGLLLATFAGVFIAVGAGHLLPESQHRDPRRAPVMVALAAAGAAVALLVRAIAPA